MRIRIVAITLNGRSRNPACCPVRNPVQWRTRRHARDASTQKPVAALAKNRLSAKREYENRRGNRPISGEPSLQATLRSYHRHIPVGIRQDGADYPEELPQTSAEIQQVFIANSDLSSSSLQTIWARLRIFWSWAESEGICANVMKGVPAPVMKRKLPRILRYDDIRLLLGSVEVERDYAILAALLDTGMRIGELASMARASVSAEGVLVSGKTGDRMVPMSPDVMKLVNRQGAERGLWVGLRGRLTDWGLQQIVRRNMRKAGFEPPKIGPHTLRHTFGMHYILKGGDVFSLQRIMGHRRLATTTIYVDMSTELVAQQHRKFSPMAGVDLPQGW